MYSDDGGFMERKHIIRVLEYIEEHLKDEVQGTLDNVTLSKIAGYSEYHFLRLFKSFVRLTPADYIRKRRISEIVCRIGEEKRSMFDIASEYGFNSKENFTRAFKKEHKILPSEFRKVNCSLRLFGPFTFDEKKPVPDISICYLDNFTLVVYPFGCNFPPDCWNYYNTKKCSIRLSGGTDVQDFGVMIYNNKACKLEYYIGIRENEAKGNIDGTVKIEAAEGLYAVFTTPAADQRDFVNKVRSTWDYIYQSWLPNSIYCRAEGYEFESYVESSRAYRERIYVPMKRR